MSDGFPTDTNPPFGQAKPMLTPATFAEAMRGADCSDYEAGHGVADDLLVQLIREHLPSFDEGLKLYDGVGKWYA